MILIKIYKSCARMYVPKWLSHDGHAKHGPFCHMRFVEVIRFIHGNEARRQFSCTDPSMTHRHLTFDTWEGGCIAFAYLFLFILA